MTTSKVEFTDRALRSLSETVRTTLGSPRNGTPTRRRSFPAHGTRTMLCQAPAGGIAARSGASCTSEDCEVIEVADNGNLGNYTVDGSNLEITVFNPFAVEITGSAYIVVALEVTNGKWIVIAEDC